MCVHKSTLHVFINRLYICVFDQQQGGRRKNRRRERQRGGGKKKDRDFSPPLCDTREEVAARESPSPYNVLPTFGNGSSSSFQWPFSPPHPLFLLRFFHREGQRASSSRGREKNAIRVAPSTGNLIVPR